MKKLNFKHVLSGLMLALVVFCAAGTVKAQAATITYDPMADTIKSDTSGVIYVLKTESQDVKSTAKYVEITQNVPLSLANDLKIAVSKDTYLFFSPTALSEDKTCKATFKRLKTDIKTVKYAIDYTTADDGEDANADAIFTWTVTDNDKKTLAKEKFTVYWSEDGTNFFATDAEEHTLNGKYIASKLEAGATIYVRMQTTSGKTRTSKPVKVKIAKQGNALKDCKIDVKKNSIAIKNGYDFRISTAATAETVAANLKDWHTVLPYNKTAKINTLDASIVEGEAYRPLAAKADKALEPVSCAYTSVKVSALELTKMAEKLVKDYYGNDATEKTADDLLDNGFFFQVRKSATSSKPATAVATFSIQGRKGAPAIYTATAVKNDFVIASGAKVEFKATTIVNAPKADNNGDKWTGIGAEVAPKTDSDDTAAAKYEFAVVAREDLNKIDWTSVSWKAIKAGTKINEKSSSKYKLIGAKTAKQVYFKKENAVANATKNTANVYLLIRRTGVKGKTASETVLASNCLVTYLSKTGEGKDVTYEWKTTEDVGVVGYKYTVNFFGWTNIGNEKTPRYGYGIVGDPLVGYSVATKDVVLDYEPADGVTPKAFGYKDSILGEGGSIDSAKFEANKFDTAAYKYDNKKITIAKPTIEDGKVGNVVVYQQLDEKANVIFKTAIKRANKTVYEEEDELTIKTGSEILSLIVGPTAKTGLAISDTNFTADALKLVPTSPDYATSHPGYVYTLADGDYLKPNTKLDAKGTALDARVTESTYTFDLKVGTKDETVFYIFYDEKVDVEIASVKLGTTTNITATNGSGTIAKAKLPESLKVSKDLFTVTAKNEDACDISIKYNGTELTNNETEVAVGGIFTFTVSAKSGYAKNKATDTWTITIE